MEEKIISERDVEQIVEKIAHRFPRGSRQQEIICKSYEHHQDLSNAGIDLIIGVLSEELDNPFDYLAIGDNSRRIVPMYMERIGIKEV
jgi:hypothetical protein